MQGWIFSNFAYEGLQVTLFTPPVSFMYLIFNWRAFLTYKKWFKAKSEDFCNLPPDVTECLQITCIYLCVIVA